MLSRRARNGFFRDRGGTNLGEILQTAMFGFTQRRDFFNRKSFQGRNASKRKGREQRALPQQAWHSEAMTNSVAKSKTKSAQSMFATCFVAHVRDIFLNAAEVLSNSSCAALPAAAMPLHV